MSLPIPTFATPSFSGHGRATARFFPFTTDRCFFRRLGVDNPKGFSFRSSLATNAHGENVHGEISVQSSASADLQNSGENASNLNDGYVPMFIRMLGLDNSDLDREQAIVALWKYSLGGKEYVDNIMKFSGAINLVVNLLHSDSESACEASAGLLRVVSSINLYREPVAASGAIEAMTVLLGRPGLSSNVKEQVLCSLWNLAVDEKLGSDISRSEVLPLVVKCLDEEDMKIQEGAGGVLATLALIPWNHKVIVEAGAIPKLARMLTEDAKDAKVARKIARNALLELVKDDYNRVLVMEEGLVVVPLVGAAAYKRFRPSLYSWPSLPDGTAIQQSPPNTPSRYGASELLVGLSLGDKSMELDESKVNAVVGRTQQQFLARIGAIEAESSNKDECGRFTLLPCIDAVARLVMILQLDDDVAVARAAESISDAAVNERMRCSFKEAGAVKHLVALTSHPNGDVKLAVLRALDRLALSVTVCQTIEEEGALQPLIHLLKQSTASLHSLKALALSILSRILDPNKEMKLKFYDEGTSGLLSKKSDQSSAGEEEICEEEEEQATRLRSIRGESLLDTDFLSCIVEILKTSSPDLQRKAASLLELVGAVESAPEKLVYAGIVSALEKVFRRRCLAEPRADAEVEKPEIEIILELEEAGLAISASSQLLLKLLDHEAFLKAANSADLTPLLRSVLRSSIPLEHKSSVAACLIKLSSESGSKFMLDDPVVDTEVTLYETIPRLIRLLEGSSPVDAQEAAVLELNRIVSEGMVGSARAVVAEGGILPVVRMMEKGSDRAVEASIAILYTVSMESENRGAIMAAGAVPVLRRIVMAEKPSWLRALRLLRTLPT